MAVLTPARRRSRTAASTAGTRERFLLFRVGGGVYAVGIGGLWEVLLPEGVTTLPTPPYQVCTGLAYRGKRLPLIRLGELFAPPSAGVPATARVLLLRGGERAVGLLTDDVLEVAEIEVARLRPLPALATTLPRGFFRGAFAWKERVVLVIDEAAPGEFEEVVRFYTDGPPAG
jgi:purine-binding chemotaxis protein CheW